MTEAPPVSFAFAGQVTRPEFERVQTRLLPVWARWYVMYPVLLVIFGAFTLPGARPSELAGDLVFVIGFPLAMRVVTKRARTQAWKQMVGLSGRVHGVITADGIEWNTERSTTRYEWARIPRIAQADGLTLAFYSKRCAFFFPRSLFESDAAWTAFNAAIAGYAAGGGRLSAARRTTSRR
jgi:hypothetical protein